LTVTRWRTSLLQVAKAMLPILGLWGNWWYHACIAVVRVQYIERTRNALAIVHKMNTYPENDAKSGIDAPIHIQTIDYILAEHQQKLTSATGAKHFLL
jgi:hypothetical protein